MITKTAINETFSDERVKKVKQIIAEKLGVDESKVVSEASFIEDLGADSLDNVELVMELEHQFGIDISDEEAQKIQTVKDAIDYVTARAKE